MAPDGSAGYSDQDGSGGCMSPPTTPKRPQGSHMALILDFHVAFGDTTDPGYGKTMNLNIQTWSLPTSGSGSHHGPRGQ